VISSSPSVITWGNAVFLGGRSADPVVAADVMPASNNDITPATPIAGATSFRALRFDRPLVRGIASSFKLAE
jgi:hypothetical protein